MEPKIIESKIFKLVGCIFYGDPFHSAEEWSYENEVGKLWQRFIETSKKYAPLLKKIAIDLNTGYEIHLEPAEYKQTKNYYIMVAIEVNNLNELPLEMFAKIFPKTDYVVFTTSMEKRFEIGNLVYKKWIPKHRYEQAFPYILQLYDNRRYKGLEDPHSEIDWFIPVKKTYSE